MNSNPIDRFLIVFAIVLFLACSKSEPEYTIEEDQLVAILVDMHMAEALLSKAPALKKDSVSLMFYNRIYEIHGVSKEKFDKNLRKLKSDPNYLEEVYQKVIDELKRREAQEE